MLLLVVCLAIGAATARAQVPSYYGEEYEKDTGKQVGKTWHSAAGYARQESPGANGKTNVMIIRRDSMKVYRLDTAKKTYITLDLSTIEDRSFIGIEALESQSHSVRRTSRGTEEVEGVDCTHYFVQRVDALKDGSTSSSDYEEWIAPDRIWRQRSDETRPGYYLVNRNVRVGEHPASLFEIPRDYTGMAMPGNLLELFGGNPQGGQPQKMGEVQQTATEAADRAGEAFEAIKQKVNDPETKQQANDVMQKLQEAFKGLGGQK